VTTAGTGIAGAMDHQVAQGAGMACVVCGAEIHGSMKGKPSARAVPGIGIIHACSDTCAEDAAFAEASGPEVAAAKAQAVALTNEVATLYFRLGQAWGDVSALRAVLQAVLDTRGTGKAAVEATRRAHELLERTLHLKWLPESKAAPASGKGGTDG